ncbi:MAG: DUF1501 domain-containing protein [Verrucomicrobiaceae bacterium]|nr:DUF1501 domain-containing protein [Verrucomicrobiaceae bacterium]
MRSISRREALQTTANGFGWLAFCALARGRTLAVGSPLAVKPAHFPPRARRVIFLCMAGGPSHVDLFDHKPRLHADTGREAPPGTMGNGTGRFVLNGSPWKFARHGDGGMWMSELLPGIARHADDICLINSMQTDQPAHPQAVLQLHTGVTQFVRPSMGAWLQYGIGTENENLPGFISIAPSAQNGGARNYSSAFLPAICQGTVISGDTDAGMADIRNARRTRDEQRAQLDFIQRLNASRLRKDVVNPEIEGVIESAELAFKMQREAPLVMDLARESEATRRLYGIGEKVTDSFGRQCLLARKLVETGVRFVQLTHGDWDHHRQLAAGLTKNCASMDRPVAGLLADLKGRGLLEDTLVIWGGEFGRTPHSQGNDGRDHNGRGFTMWMAGGGVKGGLTYGRTDDYGYAAVESPMHIHDWHATVLYLLGIDHERLVFHHAGRDFRLTDGHGSVAKSVLA